MDPFIREKLHIFLVKHFESFLAPFVADRNFINPRINATMFSNNV